MCIRDSVEAVARRVVELLGDERPRPRFVGTNQLANLFGVGADYVRRHAEELGARRLGDGEKARLRFDPDEAMARFERMTSRCAGEESDPAESPVTKRDAWSLDPRPFGTRVPLVVDTSHVVPGPLLQPRDGRSVTEGAMSSPEVVALDPSR